MLFIISNATFSHLPKVSLKSYKTKNKCCTANQARNTRHWRVLQTRKVWLWNKQVLLGKLKKKHNYCLVKGNYISSFCELFFYFFYCLHRSIQPATSRVSRKVQTKQSVNEPFQHKLNPIKNKHMIYSDLIGGPAATPANPQSNHHLLYGQVKHAAGNGP